MYAPIQGTASLIFEAQASGQVDIDMQLVPIYEVTKTGGAGTTNFAINTQAGSVTLSNLCVQGLADGAYAADIQDASMYYPFGSLQPGRHSTTGNSHRYGFNGMEKDDEIKGNGNSYTTMWRGYDPRLGRWLSIDPKWRLFAGISPYAFSLNMPILLNDPQGDCPPGIDCDGTVDPISNPSIVHNRASSLDIPERVRSNGSTYTHTGWDIYAPVGTDVNSIYSGEVIDVYDAPNSTSSYGTTILIAHYRNTPTTENPDAREVAFYSFYAHMSNVTVSVGDQVSAGQSIGQSGKTGNAHDVAEHREHLHFEVSTEIRTTGAGRQMPTSSSRFSPNEVLPTTFVKSGSGAANTSGVVRTMDVSTPGFINGIETPEILKRESFPYNYGEQSSSTSSEIVNPK